MHNFRPDNHGIDYSRLQKYEFRSGNCRPSIIRITLFTSKLRIFMRIRIFTNVIEKMETRWKITKYRNEYLLLGWQLSDCGFYH